MRIYTKTGDDGTTGLFGAKRIKKDHPRVVAYGEVDELNSWLGLIRSRQHQSPQVAQLDGVLERIQNRLFTIGSCIATPQQSAVYAKIPQLAAADVWWLEAAIDQLTEALTPLTQFILPGGDPEAAGLQVARAICRRAERSVVSATQDAAITLDPLIVQYLNRLSDLLFTMARWVNFKAGIAETRWEKNG